MQPSILLSAATLLSSVAEASRRVPRDVPDASLQIGDIGVVGEHRQRVEFSEAGGEIDDDDRAPKLEVLSTSSAMPSSSTTASTSLFGGTTSSFSSAVSSALSTSGLSRPSGSSRIPSPFIRPNVTGGPLPNNRGQRKGGGDGWGQSPPDCTYSVITITETMNFTVSVTASSSQLSSASSAMYLNTTSSLGGYSNTSSAMSSTGPISSSAWSSASYSNTSSAPFFTRWNAGVSSSTASFQNTSSTASSAYLRMSSASASSSVYLNTSSTISSMYLSSSSASASSSVYLNRSSLISYGGLSTSSSSNSRSSIDPISYTNSTSAGTSSASQFMNASSIAPRTTPPVDARRPIFPPASRGSNTSEELCEETMSHFRPTRPMPSAPRSSLWVPPRLVQMTASSSAMPASSPASSVLSSSLSSILPRSSSSGSAISSSLSSSSTSSASSYSSPASFSSSPSSSPSSSFSSTAFSTSSSIFSSSPSSSPSSSSSSSSRFSSGLWSRSPSASPSASPSISSSASSSASSSISSSISSRASSSAASSTSTAVSSSTSSPSTSSTQPWTATSTVLISLSTATPSTTQPTTAPSSSTTTSTTRAHWWTSCVIDTRMPPAVTASVTAAFTTAVVPTKTVGAGDAPTGLPSPDHVHCGVHGLPVGDYFIGEFVQNKDDVPVTLEGCFQFCSSVWGSTHGCLSYDYFVNDFGAPRCLLYGSPVAFAVDAIDNHQPNTWFDLECGDPTSKTWSGAGLPGVSKVSNLGSLLNLNLDIQ